MEPSSPAVARDPPSCDHFREINCFLQRKFTAPFLCASLQFFSNFPNLEINLKLPSMKPIATESFTPLLVGFQSKEVGN